MIRLILLIAATLMAGAAPMLPGRAVAPVPFQPWPAAFEGRPIHRIAAGPGDEALARDFPGHVARFSDGRRQIVLRQVARPTRLLHPARDCFEALGYRLEPLPMRAVPGGHAACFRARRGDTKLDVCEQVRDARGTVYSDVPSWFWPALTGASTGPWLAVMTVEQAG